MKSASSASLGKLWSAGGQHGTCLRNVRRAASRYTKQPGKSESPCGAPSVQLNGADRVSSTLTMIFVSDSRSRMIQKLFVSRSECKTSRSFFQRIVLNSRDKLIPSILITYLYHWYFATSHRCLHTTFVVDHQR